MKRNIIKINIEKCNGCGLCADACHEGAIGMKQGKAVLLRDDYCDGLGDCLPICPTGAITFEEREAAAYDKAAAAQSRKTAAAPPPRGCPGSQSRAIPRQTAVKPAGGVSISHLCQWPVQIKLLPQTAPYYQNADVLIAADCCAYAYGAFHERFLKGRVTLIGCPKLDGVDYSEKLEAIFKNNSIRSVTVVRMEVPCCAGIAAAAQRAVINSGKNLPLHIVTISTQGELLD